jgi:chromatin remodeling complex protein RSC6
MAPKKINTAAPAPAVEAPATPVAEAPVVDAPVADVAPSTDAAAAPSDAPAAPLTTSEKLAALAKLFDSLHVIVKDIGLKLKQGQKDTLLAQKEAAQLEKEKGRRSKGRAAKAAAAAAALEGGAAPAAPRRPSGFATPATLSAQLSEFLGVPEGTKMARTDVTRLITEYVKKNQLHDSADKRIIKSDDKLKQILGGDDGKPLTYFNLQTHIKHHFIKNDAAAAAVAPVVDAAPAPVAV